MNYVLTVSEKQAKILVDALDVYSRLGMGQLADAVALLPFEDGFERGYAELVEIGKILKPKLKSGINCYNSSLGIGHPETPEKSKIAYELQQVVRKQIAWDEAIRQGIVENHKSPRNFSKMLGYCYDDPLKLSSEPLAEIELINNSNKE